MTGAPDDLFLGPETFFNFDPAGAHGDPARARAWVLPVPYEGTTSYGAGTRFGPAAIIDASREVELYDREFGCEAGFEYGVHTLPRMALEHSSPGAMAARVERAVEGILSGEPAPELLVTLGGEHSITPGVIRAVAKARSDLAGDLVCVQVDAHADLRDEYEGTPASHASAMRRVLETCPVFQIGIRNISAREEEFRRSTDRVRTVFAEEATMPDGAFLSELAEFCRGRPVYLTVDLDGLDPSVMPATGTPEPGGLSWERTLDIVRTVAREASVVPAFDVVELAPVGGLRAPDFLAAKLAYKIMSHVLLRGRGSR
ncbi:MAG: agmatinase [Planctomycetota bacterium]|jgi:agmatinase